MAQDSFLVGLVGSGIAPSLSPMLHEREADRHGVRYLYRLLDLDAQAPPHEELLPRLLAAARTTGFNGLNITHPCKQAVLPHLDALSAQAADLGAVNTVVFADDQAVGHNTDTTGFAAAFTRRLADAPLRSVVQLGAGGAGSAVAHALLGLGLGHLTLVDRVQRRATALADALRAQHGTDRIDTAVPEGLAGALAEADGLVHATPTGMAHSPGLPLPPQLLRAPLWVADIVYRPLETPLLRAARERGCRTLDGGGMAVFQAAHSFRLFTGRTPDTERMLADLTALTTDVEPPAPSRP